MIKVKSLFVLLFVTNYIIAAGFIVKPMRIEVNAEPGKEVTTKFDLQNFNEQEAKTLDVELFDFVQTENGQIQPVEKPEQNKPSRYSCLKWITLSQNSVEVQPMQTSSMVLTFKIPPGASGVYYAAITAQSRPDPSVKGLSLVVRFLVPIIVTVKSGQPFQKIVSNDLSLIFKPMDSKSSASTIAAMSVANNGRTYSRIKGSLTVMRFFNNHWQNVTTAELKDTGIVPDVNFNMTADLKRNFPSGKYKLLGNLLIDGRRTKPLEKEIDYVGDPSVTKIAYDTSLLLDPQTIEINATPASVRTSVLKVENNSQEQIEVEVAQMIPKMLKNAACGDILGDKLSCEKWLTVMPNKFTLRPNGRQSIKIIAKIPQDDTNYPNYYAMLMLLAKYSDGQSAGDRNALVCIANKGVKPQPNAQFQNNEIFCEEGSLYVVRTKLANVGNTHFMPKCKVLLTKTIGDTVSQTYLAGDSGIMLPLEIRDFSTTLNFTNVEDGFYYVKYVCEDFFNKDISVQIPVKVSTSEGKKIVEIVSSDKK